MKLNKKYDACSLCNTELSWKDKEEKILLKYDVCSNCWNDLRKRNCEHNSYLDVEIRVVSCSYDTRMIFVCSYCGAQIKSFSIWGGTYSDKTQDEAMKKLLSIAENNLIETQVYESLNWENQLSLAKKEQYEKRLEEIDSMISKEKNK